MAPPSPGIRTEPLWNISGAEPFGESPCMALQGLGACSWQFVPGLTAVIHVLAKTMVSWSAARSSRSSINQIRREGTRAAGTEREARRG